MNLDDYGAMVIGCGPGGSSTATFLAQVGKQVLVLEKAFFPRFHIGESLLPCDIPTFRGMGVLAELQATAFPRKFGARFELSNGTLGVRFPFRSTVKKRMRNAVPMNETRTTSDFSYYNRRLAGHRLLRVGDTAGFLDAIFSAGIFLAMWSGKLAAETVLRAIARDRPSGRPSVIYEKRIMKGLMFYRRLMENYYTMPFMKLFLRLTERWNLFSAVIGVPAGEVERNWALRWRMQLFFLLVKIQARWRIALRINSRPIVIVNKNPPAGPSQL